MGCVLNVKLQIFGAGRQAPNSKLVFPWFPQGELTQLSMVARVRKEAGILDAQTTFEFGSVVAKDPNCSEKNQENSRNHQHRSFRSTFHQVLLHPVCHT